VKKLFFLLLVIGGIAAAVTIIMRRNSESSYEDSWDTFSDMGSKVRDKASELGRSARGAA